jgi:hypothetical protein
LDIDGRPFTGWSSKFDEILNIHSPRIQPLNTMAKKFYPDASSNTDDPVIEDSNDILFVNMPKPNPLFAVIRYLESKSVLIIQMINYLGLQRFFDKLLKRLEDKTNPCPFDVVVGYTSLLGQLIFSILFKFLQASYSKTLLL